MDDDLGHGGEEWSCKKQIRRERTTQTIYKHATGHESSESIKNNEIQLLFEGVEATQ